MPADATPPVAEPVEIEILKVLHYFKVFSWPLTAEEVWIYYRGSVAQLTIRQSLDQLVRSGKIFQFGIYYQLSDVAEWVDMRSDYNQRADQFMPVAKRMAKLIGSFPFIRGVFISGSLSKNAMGPTSDIDFFMITEPGRLWVARTLLVLFKRIFLLNSHKYFCINYFIDTDHLIIKERNIFTAVEMVTMLPMYDGEWYMEFRTANRWAWEMLPNFPEKTVESVPRHQKKGIKKIVEWLLSGSLGEWLDIRAMQVTVAFWRRKFSHFDDITFEFAIRSKRYESKHHPLQYQRQVMKVLNDVEGLVS